MPDEVIEEFLVESLESLNQIETDLVSLEDTPSEELVGRIFRNVHTIKGTCGFLGFERLEKVAHAGENLLSKVRSKELEPHAEVVSALLETIDAIRTLLGLIEKTEHDGEEDYPDLRERLAALTEGRALPPDTSPEPDDEAIAAAVEEAAASEEPEPEPVEATPEPEPVKPPSEPAKPALAVVAQADDEPTRSNLRMAERSEDEHEDDHDEPHHDEPHHDEHPERAKRSAADSSIRVSVDLLDSLMNLVGELVLVRNQILQHHAQIEDPALNAASQRLNLVTTELQEGVMRTRMQPIGQVFGKFPRVVRDLAKSLGKQVRIEMEGRETELDKTLLEAIKDPLTHLVRNSVDHGIESPEQRRAKGKAAEGVVRLRAFHEGGQVNVEIVDDGGGIDVQKVADKALVQGLVSRTQLERMTERQLLNLIFLPGFSTATTVTAVSGRGVGMDVVRTNIERIGGTVDVQTSTEGTTFRVKIPLTLAIVPALVVSSGGDRYAIPQVSLSELVRLEEEEQRRIEHIGDTPVYRLRGNLLPLVYLHEQLGVDLDKGEDDDGAINIAVLNANDKLFGLVVESIHDTEEIVVKPLSAHLKGIAAFAGATIMGDGRVALILDALGVATTAGLAATEDDAALFADDESSLLSDLEETLLLFEVADQKVVGVPLSQVERLEEFPANAVETAGYDRVVQYRNAILPLKFLGEELYRAPSFTPDPRAEGSLQVMVCRHQSGSTGLVVDRLIDIIKESVELEPHGKRRGIAGSSILQGKVVEMVEVSDIVGDEVMSVALAAE